MIHAQMVFKIHSDDYVTQGVFYEKRIDIQYQHNVDQRQKKSEYWKLPFPLGA